MNPQSTNRTPALSLDDLATAWLPRRMTDIAALPGLNNSIGSIQVTSDIAAIQHPVFPPYSGANEITGITLLNGRQLAQLGATIEIRWRAHEIQRRCTVDDWELTSRTSLIPDQPGSVVRVRIVNRGEAARTVTLAFLLSGRAMNNGMAGYHWSVPTVPTAIDAFQLTAGLRQTVTALPDWDEGRLIANEAGNGYSVQAASPAPHRWRTSRSPEWIVDLPPGEAFEVDLLFTWHENAAAATSLAGDWRERTNNVFDDARTWWNSLWSAAFSPKNAIFSGHLPVVRSEVPAVEKLYYMGVLTLLTCRREYPNAKVSPAYITLWPRHGEGCGFLDWELPYTGGILARLDPAVLMDAWKLLTNRPGHENQITNYLDGISAGWPCCAHSQAVISTASNLARWSRNRDFVPEIDADGPDKAALTSALLVHRKHHLPGKPLVDFGSRNVYLECITNYAHGTAAHTAVQAAGLREFIHLLDEAATHEVAALEKSVFDLYREDAGYFQCEYPDGTRYDAPNLYDIGMVLCLMGDRLPRPMLTSMVSFAKRELLTDQWAHCLWAADEDAASGVRCDHQWAGCFVGWPAQFIAGLANSGIDETWMTDWLERLSVITAQGPFAQAYWAETTHPTEAGGPAKCFDENPQLNHWVIGTGAYYAELILETVCGQRADLAGHVSSGNGLRDWASKTRVLD